MKEKQFIYLVYWDGFAHSTYLYGSKVYFEQNRYVHYENEMMPPGTVIKKWYSEVNYQAQRTEPQLPVLEVGESYEFRTFLNVTPSKGVKLRIRFFNQQNESLGEQILEEKVEKVFVPPRMYRYELDLIHTGARKLEFHHIEIQKSTEAKKNRRKEGEGSHLNVLVLEPKGRCYELPDGKLLKRFHNLYITTADALEAFELGDGELDTMVDELPEGKLRVIGYGAVSDRVAYQYVRYVGKGAKAYVYQDDGFTAGRHLVIYGKKDSDTHENTLWESLVGREERLDEILL